jgi:Na+/H+ antiporter NhaC
LQSIKYRYYPIFMILIMLFLIVAKRDYGSMLIAERKTMVYRRTDGGDSSVSKKTSMEDANSKPRADTPACWWNMLIPMSVLVFLIFWLLVKSGEDKSIKQSILDKLQESDSYKALLWGTIGTTFLTMLFYFAQIVQNGRLVFPTPTVILGLFRKADDESAPRFLMPMKDCVESFLHGMARIFPALIILTLAWAVGVIMTSVGVDRLVSRWITDRIDPSLLPTLSFIISVLMAMATGTSWGTMSIMFPLLMRATYVSSDGNPRIFYSTVAGILSGAVAGDHVSPISDTTVLSALACECKLMAHVGTQMPYAVVVMIVSILFGTLPYGRGAWPNLVGLGLGSVALIAFVYLICKPIVNANGSYDIMTEIFLRAKNNLELLTLKADTIAFYEEQQGGLPVAAAQVQEKAVGSSDEDVTPQYVEVDKVEKAVVAENPHDESMA